MKKKKKIFVSILIFLIYFAVQIAVCYAEVAGGHGTAYHANKRAIGTGGVDTVAIVSRGVAIILSIFQVLQYVVPALYLSVRLSINHKRKDGSNTKKNIVSYVFITIAICLSFVGIGQLILDLAPTYGYSSLSADYIIYNGKIVYFHR